MKPVSMSRVTLAIFLSLIATTSILLSRTSVRAQPGGLRSLDWAAVLASEPAITVGAECPAAFPSLRAMGVCVDVRVDPPRPVEGNFGGPVDGFTGVALVGTDSGGPLYGDIDGDGV